MLDISYKINNNNQLISTTTNIQNKKTNNRQYTVPLSSPKSPQKSLENKNISQSLLPIYLNQKTFFPFFSTNIQQKPKLCAKLSDKIKNIKQNENKQLNGYFEEEEERIRRFSIADLAEAALRHQRHQKQLYRSVAVIECCQQQNNQQKCPTANFYIKCLCKENKIKINKTKNTFSSLSRGPSLLRHRRRLFSQYQQKRNCSSSGTHPRPSSRNSGSFFSSTEEKCNGDLTQPSSILVNSSGGGCNYINNNCLSTTLPPLNNEINTKSLEWSPTIEEKILNKKTDQTNILQQRQQQILRRRQSGYGISITTESQAKMRCKLRKLYFLKRNKICDLSLALAIIGLIFIVLDQELTATKIVTKTSLPSLFLRSACVASTLLLIASLVNYHRTEVKIALIDSGAEDWRVAVTTDRIIKLFIEIFVCAICPFPGSGTISWPYISADEHRFTQVPVPLDVLLAVPMFLRAYLLCRFMVLHSRQFQDAATRSIAALNRISMDFRFVIKTMMADHPMTVLVIFTCCYWVCMSWMFTQCERYNGKEGSTEYYYMNSLWFIMVTFMSIGYGDVVPTSYCGRLLSITTGIVGAGVSSALIAVISRKLELSRAEKHVNNFMADSKLTNARKNAAASVLQHTWFIHKYQQRNGHKGDEIRLRQHQRRFLNSINEFRRIKWDQRKLQERGNSLLDVGKLHTEMHETLWEMHRTQDQFVGMIEILTQRITELQQTVLNASNIQQQQIYTNNQLFPPNNDRKISKEKQLRVPINNLNNSKKISSNHPQQQKQSNNLFLQTHPSINNSKQNNSIIISGFESNLGLTNSCSSPCLQKSQQQQQTILHKMRVLKDEDECIPLMNDKEMMA